MRKSYFAAVLLGLALLLPAAAAEPRDGSAALSRSFFTFTSM